MNRNLLSLGYCFIRPIWFGTLSRRSIRSWGKALPEQCHCQKPWVRSLGWPHFSNLQCNSIINLLYILPFHWGHHQLRPRMRIYHLRTCPDPFFSHFGIILDNNKQGSLIPWTNNCHSLRKFQSHPKHLTRRRLLSLNIKLLLPA